MPGFGGQVGGDDQRPGNDAVTAKVVLGQPSAFVAQLLGVTDLFGGLGNYPLEVSVFRPGETGEEG